VDTLASEVYNSDKPPYLDKYSKVAETGDPIDFETYYPPMDKYFHISVFSPKKGQFATGFSDITERKEKERKLKQTKDRLNSILDNTRDVIWSLNWPDLDLNFITPSAEKIYGYSPEEFEQNPELWQEVVHPEDRHLNQKALEKIKEKGEVERIARIITKDGNVRWINDRSKMIYDENDEPIRCDGVTRDITERKNMGESLKKSEERLKLAMDAGEHGFWDWNLDTDDVYFSPRYYTMLDYEPGELPMVLDTWGELMHPEDRKTIVPKVQKYVENAEPYEVEFRLKCKDGSWKWISGRGKSFEIDENGKPRRAVGVHVDITERVRAEGELRESKTRLQGLFETMAEGMIFIAPDGQIVQANPAAERMLGFQRSEIEARNYIAPEWEILRPDGTPMPPEEMAGPRAMKEKRLVKDVVMGAKRPNGTISWINVSAAPLINEAGEIEGVVGTFADITERKQAEEALQEYSERLEEMVEERTRELRDAQEELIRQERLAALGQIAGSMGHELRNPLGVIHNANYYLGMKLAEADEDVKESIELIAEETQNASKIIADLLDFGRAQAADPALVNVSEVVNAVIGQNPPPDEVTLSVDVPDNLPPIFVDELQIKHVLTNLITNAYQAMPEGGELSVESGQSTAGSVMIEISDTGTGIPPENLEKIFEPLFTTKSRGIGLGLAICKKLIAANGGKIEVESTVGEGSTFHVYVPMFGQQ
ncbi:MAG: PAS domain S-box protein, partial [Chloroflexota bacterium]|nr:PAS domain S-box protein [Chloroflexota bacterium]